DAPHAAVQCDPGHDFRVREMPPRAANFPDALVWTPPGLFNKTHQRLFHAPTVLVVFQSVLAGLVKSVEYFAVHVELKLLEGGIADPHGPGVLVAGEPVEFDLGQPSFAAEAVHDVGFARYAGDGPDEP